LKRVYLLALLLLMGCFHGQAVMTLNTFQSIPTGTSEERLRKTYGAPLHIYHKANGLTVYEYSERFTLGPIENRVVEERRYYFYIRDGVVTSKQMVIQNPPAFEPMNDVNPSEI
jgi:hypothetical protein